MASRRTLLAIGPAVVVVVVALCLRGPFAAVGPVLGELSEQLSVPLTALAVLAALPLVVFGLLSPVAPVLAARLGLYRAVVAGTLLLALGIAVRLAGPLGLYVGTVLLAGGIAIANVLLPAVARAEYGPRAAGVVGLVTAALGVSAALGTGLAQPLEAATGSALRGLSLWLLPVAVAVLAAGLLARRRRAAAAAPPQPAGRRGGILRDRVALAVTIFFGLQSLLFYVLLTWLPDILEEEAGVGPVAAGGLTALAALLGGPLSLVVPTVTARMRSQVSAVVWTAVPLAAGLAGLLLAPSWAPWLWALLYGLGTAASFPLAMTLVLLRSRDVAQTGRLSATAQSVGYLLAATGPVMVGALHEATGGWRAGLVLSFGALIAMTAAGVAAGRPRLLATTS